MAKRSRILRVGQWSGLLACLAIPALSLVNLRYAVSINLPPLTCWMGDWTLYFSGPGRFAEYCYRTQWLVDVAEYFDKAKLWPNLEGPTFGRAWHIGIPLWLLLIALALPTCLMWWRDWKRIPEGCCQSCDYYLTGNESGRCSECGTTV